MQASQYGTSGRHRAAGAHGSLPATIPNTEQKKEKERDKVIWLDP